MTVLLHLSDPHFGCEVPEVLRALGAFCRDLGPDALVLSGDVTQRARRAQFRAAAAFVESLGVADRIVIPGNHDIPLFNLPARIGWPYAGFRRAFGEELAPSIVREDLLVLSVLTTRRHRHVDGEVSMPQIESVAMRLREAAPRQLRVVVTHQPVYVTRESERHNLLHNHEAAIAAWSAAGADLVLGGHIHLPYVREIARVPRRLWIAQAGTAVSKRVRHDAPNSVNVIRYESPDAGALIERWDCAPGAERFAVRESTRIELSRP